MTAFYIQAQAGCKESVTASKVPCLFTTPLHTKAAVYIQA